MIIEVIRYEITVDYVGYPNWTTGRFICVRWDDATNIIYDVQIRDGSNNLVETPTSGPPIFSGSNGMATQHTPHPLYGWCDGTTLNRVVSLNTFPYATYQSFPNHMSCQIVPVCDLDISNTVTVTEASGPATADGGFVVSATSSNGLIRYSLDPNFNYSTGGNTDGVFTGLYPGDYTVYAKDSIGCQDSITVTIKITTDYGVLYRMEYDTVGGFKSRVDIEERAYEGYVIEVCGGPLPFRLNYDDSDRYTTFIQSYADIELLEETQGQFVALRTDDDRKFLVKHYKYIADAWILKWVGFLIPSLNQYSFVRSTNTVVGFKASDQLGNLSQEDFVDDNGNRFKGDVVQMDIIAAILRKTGLTINIRCADNLFETTMDDGPEDDPLAQAKFDSRILYTAKKTTKSDEALSEVIRCKSGLRLFQSLGYWWLVRSEMAVGSIEFREFDINGVYQSNGTYDPVVDRILPLSGTGIWWSRESQMRMDEQNYGSFDLTHTLNFDDNFIDEGDFEEEHVIVNGDGSKGIKNWNVQVNQPGLNYGIEYVENKESKAAFYADFDAVSGTQTDNVLYSTEIPYEQGGRLKFSFEYNVVPFYKLPWIRIAWQLRFTTDLVGTYYLVDGAFGGDYLTEEIRNDIYVDRYNQFQKFEITFPSNLGSGTVRIALFFHNHRGKDFNSIAGLSGSPTEDVTPGKRYIVFDEEDGNGYMYFYELELNRDAEDIPNVVRPIDYQVTSNAKIWRLKGKYVLQQSLVDKILFDNVKFSFIPYDAISSSMFSPPETAVYSQVVNRFNKHKYSEDFLLGDLPDMINSKQIYRGWLRKLDGTPTVFWKRKGVSEEKRLLSLALEDRVAQWSNPVERIEATVEAKTVFCSFINAINDNGTRYLITKYSLDDKNNSLYLMLDKTAVGEDGEPPVSLGEYNPEEYSNTEYRVS